MEFTVPTLPETAPFFVYVYPLFWGWVIAMLGGLGASQARHISNWMARVALMVVLAGLGFYFSSEVLKYSTFINGQARPNANWVAAVLFVFMGFFTEPMFKILWGMGRWARFLLLVAGVALAYFIVVILFWPGQLLGEGGAGGGGMPTLFDYDANTREMYINSWLLLAAAAGLGYWAWKKFK